VVRWAMCSLSRWTVLSEGVASEGGFRREVDPNGEVGVVLGLGLGSWMGLGVSWSERDGDGASVLQAVHRLRPIHRINTNLSLSLSLSLSLVSRESSITRNTYNYFDFGSSTREARRGE